MVTAVELTSSFIKCQNTQNTLTETQSWHTVGLSSVYGGVYGKLVLTCLILTCLLSSFNSWQKYPNLLDLLDFQLSTPDTRLLRFFTILRRVSREYSWLVWTCILAVVAYSFMRVTRIETYEIQKLKAENNYKVGCWFSVGFSTIRWNHQES